ncbi:Calreticulin-domain-containing protein [Hyphopichia burtonii NRRL Y-1933]|uniref:Calreticulin-domain-containing protein n=1 Tax=Hyphopichia burtonii NRRL Y-1933 TaxID=984485 RepID=A0A1E4RDB4_9ASCO|nr:Calreticulin-domain-containing protein [Hyphopichia burtonii NRRL Y-1933]ODV65115.1 Calreticulin-domain-containing protein [Hyphopichia burtonii NRRL Y-1933]
MKLSCFSVGVTLAVAAGVAIASDVPEYKPLKKSVLKNAAIFEQFDYEDINESPWRISHAEKDDEFTYRGQWAIETSKVYPGFKGDKGLVMKTPAAYHAISYKLNESFDNTDQDLVLQYEIKLQDGLSCGGTYVKLLNQGYDESEFNGETPYQIMFGPDVCGSNDKVHFIINRPNPSTGEVEAHHLRTAPMSRNDQLTNLYTLILKKNQDFEIRINGDVAKAGNLVKNTALLTPPLNPPEEIEDPYDTKPLSWDDRKFIPDPNYPAKPDDYDELYGNAYIPDPEAVKPEDWDESEPLFIPDPEAVKPEDWNDEEDGEWISPDIINPICETKGCGEWQPPMVPNANYRGIWLQPDIINPNYKGTWKPRKILNPDYYEDKTPSNIGLIDGIGFELWTMSKDIMFDNIYLGHSIKEAELIGNLTYNPKSVLENDDYDLNRPRAPIEPIQPPVSFEDFLNDDNESTLTQFIEFIRIVFLRQFLDIKDFYYEFRLNPLDLILNEPLKFVVYCCAFLTIFTFGFAIINVLVFVLAASKQELPKNETPEQEAKIVEIKDDEPSATGVEEHTTKPIKRH